MTRFVLLHSPLLGPLTWRAVAAELAALGHAAQTPAWPRLIDLDEGFYEPLVREMAGEIGESTGPAVLVAHSGAGPLLPALAERLGPSVSGAIFVDSFLPHPGRSWFDMAPDSLRQTLRSGAQAGLLPPWHDWWPPGALERLVPDEAFRDALVDELTPIPAAYFEEPAPTATLSSQAAYLKLSESYEDEARLANRSGWPLVRLPLTHMAPITHPEAVALALQGLAERLAA